MGKSRCSAFAASGASTAQGGALEVAWLGSSQARHSGTTAERAVSHMPQVGLPSASTAADGTCRRSFSEQPMLVAREGLESLQVQGPDSADMRSEQS